MFVFDRNTAKLKKLTKKDFTHEYGEQTTTPSGVGLKYFFEAGAIHCYETGGKTREMLQEKHFKKAESIMYSWAREYADTHHSLVCADTSEEMAAALAVEIRSLMEQCDCENKAEVVDTLKTIDGYLVALEKLGSV